MDAILKQVDHRPWPLPSKPWAMAMTWHDLLFMHWPVETSALRPWIPDALEIDTFDGRAWIGVVPFYMSGVLARGTPALPWFSAFAELNVRTYVTLQDKPGVWFFSLDAANPVAVRVARRFFHLPYYDARMSITPRPRCDPRADGHPPAADVEGWITYTSRRTHRGAKPAEFKGQYRPIDDPGASCDPDLTRWLTERYCLYAADRRGRAWRGEIHHVAWPLRPAQARIERNTMTEPLGILPPDLPPLLHFARRLDVVAWLPLLVTDR